MELSLPALSYILQSLIVMEYNLKRQRKVASLKPYLNINNCFLKTNVFVGPHKENINMKLHEKKNCFTEFLQ